MSGSTGGPSPASLIPNLPGLYALDLQLEHGRTIRVGRRGEFTFEPGSYIYIGSARGPGGLHARIARHARHHARPVRHWHIDALLGVSSLNGAWWAVDSAHKECEWALLLAQSARRWPEAFGASDCRCAGHLLHFRSNHQAARSLQALLDRSNSVSGYYRAPDDKETV